MCFISKNVTWREQTACCFQQPWIRSGREEAGAARSFSAAVQVEDFKVEIKRTSKSSSSPSSVQFLRLNDLFASDLCFTHTRIRGWECLILLPQFPYKIVKKSVLVLERLASTQAGKDEDPSPGAHLDRLCYDQKTQRAHSEPLYQMQTWDQKEERTSVGTLSWLWRTAPDIERLYLGSPGLTLSLSSSFTWLYASAAQSVTATK